MGKVLKVREIGDPVLYEKSEIVDIKKDNINEIIEDLKETLEFSIGGLGIAAPQIGVNKRIIVIGAKKENINYNNPIDDEVDYQYEGCMSVPQIRGKVKRYKNIKLQYINENGEYIEKEAHNFLARLVQHECDHLDGIVFIQKVEENGFATKEMINKYNLK